ncbi:MAG: putative selenate ABC transporter substrate-binding protein [Hyphomicrobiaceae bacterium]|nr:putative selenate ABC transporter substrate-binding protein [Hyphomicrobiaceae bacterium]
MLTTVKRSILALAAMSALTAGYALAQQATLVFTAIPDEDETRLVERFTQYAKYFEGKLGVPVKYLPVKSYPAAVTAFTNNQVQFAWFGGLTGVQARLAVPGSQALAQGEEDQQFKSYFIAHVSTGLKLSQEFPKGIEGKTFTFGARASTSGRLFPEHFIRQAMGKDPEKVFARIGYSGDHSRTIQLVQSGAYQVGVLNHLVWEQEVKSGKVDTKAVSVIWETPTYPDYHWVARGDIDTSFGSGFMGRLQAAILAVDDPKLLAIFDRKRFIPANNDDYKVIEDVGKVTGLIN